MRHIVGILAAAGLVVFGAGAASAQGVEVRVVRDHYRPHVERRVVHPRRVRTVCRTVVREHVRPNGVVVRRPTEVCRREVVGRRVYVD
jgi:hypothetical protein